MMLSIRTVAAALVLAGMVSACGGGGGGGGGNASGGGLSATGADAFTKAVQAAVAMQNADSADPEDVNHWSVVDSDSAEPVAVL